jgi:hypothetical protein
VAAVVVEIEASEEDAADEEEVLLHGAAALDMAEAASATTPEVTEAAATLATEEAGETIREADTEATLGREEIILGEMISLPEVGQADPQLEGTVVTWQPIVDGAAATELETPQEVEEEPWGVRWWGEAPTARCRTASEGEGLVRGDGEGGVPVLAEDGNKVWENKLKKSNEHHEANRVRKKVHFSFISLKKETAKNYLLKKYSKIILFRQFEIESENNSIVERKKFLETRFLSTTLQKADWSANNVDPPPFKSYQILGSFLFYFSSSINVAFDCHFLVFLS